MVINSLTNIIVCGYEATRFNCGAGQSTASTTLAVLFRNGIFFVSYTLILTVNLSVNRSTTVSRRYLCQKLNTGKILGDGKGLFSRTYFTLRSYTTFFPVTDSVRDGPGGGMGPALAHGGVARCTGHGRAGRGRARRRLAARRQAHDRTRRRRTRHLDHKEPPTDLALLPPWWVHIPSTATHTEFVNFNKHRTKLLHLRYKDIVLYILLNSLNPNAIFIPAKANKDGKPEPCKPILRLEWKTSRMG